MCVCVDLFRHVGDLLLSFLGVERINNGVKTEAAGKFCKVQTNKILFTLKTKIIVKVYCLVKEHQVPSLCDYTSESFSYITIILSNLMTQEDESRKEK